MLDEFSAKIRFNVNGIICCQRQFESKFTAFMDATLACKNYRYRHIISPVPELIVADDNMCWGDNICRHTNLNQWVLRDEVAGLL